MLSIKNASVNYHNVNALNDVSFEVDQGAFVTLIGSNGAGKSTTLRAISGLSGIAQGEIRLKGETIHHLSPDQILRKGIAHVPEGRRVFKDLNVYENLQLGAYIHNDTAQIAADMELVYERFPRLRERMHQHARSLSGGEQQMLAIGRALMSRPEILLLDEPSLGLAPLIIKEIGRILKEINQKGVTVILVEQNADMALHLADYAHVLETGSITLSGKGSDLAGNEHVKKAYLGI